MSKIKTLHSESDTERDYVPNTNMLGGILVTLLFGSLIGVGLVLMLAPRPEIRPRAHLENARQ